jgi:toxin ParE1/3/4
MLDLRFTPPADADLEDIFYYGLTNFGLQVAQKYHQELKAVFEQLRTFPFMGRIRSDWNRAPRCLSFREHLILYDTNDVFITIRRIVHSNMDDPEIEET